MTSDFYDPEGNHITIKQANKLLEKRREDLLDDSWWRKQTHLIIDDEKVTVSTVWLGLDYSFGEGPPLFWETMVFGGEYDDSQWRYSSKEAALEAHERIVKSLQEGREV